MHHMFFHRSLQCTKKRLERKCKAINYCKNDSQADTILQKKGIEKSVQQQASPMLSHKKPQLTIKGREKVKLHQICPASTRNSPKKEERKYQAKCSIKCEPTMHHEKCGGTVQATCYIKIFPQEVAILHKRIQNSAKQQTTPNLSHKHP